MLLKAIKTVHNT